MPRSAWPAGSRVLIGSGTLPGGREAHESEPPWLRWEWPQPGWGWAGAPGSSLIAGAGVPLGPSALGACPLPSVLATVTQKGTRTGGEHVSGREPVHLVGCTLSVLQDNTQDCPMGPAMEAARAAEVFGPGATLRPPQTPGPSPLLRTARPGAPAFPRDPFRGHLAGLPDLLSLTRSPFLITRVVTARPPRLALPARAEAAPAQPPLSVPLTLVTLNCLKVLQNRLPDHLLTL